MSQRCFQELLSIGLAITTANTWKKVMCHFEVKIFHKSFLKISLLAFLTEVNTTVSIFLDQGVVRTIKFSQTRFYLKIAAPFPLPYRWGKSAAISKLESFLTDLNRSYIVLALVISFVERVIHKKKNPPVNCTKIYPSFLY